MKEGLLTPFIIQETPAAITIAIAPACAGTLRILHFILPRRHFVVQLLIEHATRVQVGSHTGACRGRASNLA